MDLAVSQDKSPATADENRQRRARAENLCPITPRRNVHIATLLGTVLALNALDLLCSLFAAKIGELREINPLAENFLRLGLLKSFVSFKILMVSCGVLMLWKLRASRWCVPACWVLIIAYVALAGVWFEWLRDTNFSYEVELSVAHQNTIGF